MITRESVVYGEAMLAMQGQREKVAIIVKGACLLRPGGRHAEEPFQLMSEKSRE